MRKYLLSILELNDLSIIQSFHIPWVGVTKDDLILYSLIVDGIEIINPDSQQEIRIESPCTRSFFVPNYSFIDLICVYKPDVNDSSSAPIISIDSNLISAYNFDEITINGKVCWDGVFRAGLPKTSPYLIKLTLTFSESGLLTLRASSNILNLVNETVPVTLNSEINVKSKDQRLLLLRNSLIKKGSAYLTWVSDSPARIYFSNVTTNFIPSESSTNVSEYYDIEPNTPTQFIDHIENIPLFFLQIKIVSDSTGVLKFTDLASPPQGGATMLNHGETIELSANDSRVFCFPKTWKSTEFLANTQYLVGMYVSNTPDFEISDASVVAKYDFSKNGNNRELQLTTGDINQLGAFALDDYLYVRFVCNKSTTLTPKLWYSSTCIENTILISSGMAFPKSNEATYRMIYKDWQNNDFTIFWGERPGLTVYVSSYCDFVTTATDLISKISVPQRKNTTVTADVVNAWANKIDENGYVYIRLNSGKAANVTFTSSKPEEIDPE